MSPKIYILLATYNRAHLIEETLDSIRDQTYSNWECIIVDDHSTDHTAVVIEQYLKKDSRFSCFLKNREHSRGLSGSRNQGLDIARRKGAEFTQFFDDDDLMHPDKLELQINQLIKNPHLDFSIGGTRNFWKKEELKEEDQKDLELKKMTLGEAYLTGNIKFVAQSLLFRIRFFKENFDEELFYAEEWELFSKLLIKYNPEYGLIKRVLFYRRKHQEAVTEKKDAEFLRLQMTIQAEVKVFHYLRSNDVHTAVTLKHFARKFLLYRYDSELLDQIGEEIKRNGKTSYLSFKVSRTIHWIAKKLILKILRY